MATASKNPPMEDGRSLLECPVCVALFRNPKSLRCGHSVCHECCEQLRTSHQITCPVCRTKTLVPAEGLPTNYALQDLVEHHSTRREDKKYACSSCERRQVIDELWFCTSCVSTLICANCAIKDHRGHELQMVAEIVNRRREELGEWRQRMENMVRDVDSRRRQIEANVTRIEQRAIQLNGILRTKLNPTLNEAVHELNDERDLLFKAIQDVDVSDIIGGAVCSGEQATAAQFHSQFQNQLNEVPQKLEAIKSKQENILADQRLALEVVQNCNEVLRQVLSTTTARTADARRQENDDSPIPRPIAMGEHSPGRIQLTGQSTHTRLGRGDRAAPVNYQSRPGLLGPFGGDSERRQPYIALGGIGRGRMCAIPDAETSTMNSTNLFSLFSDSMDQGQVDGSGGLGGAGRGLVISNQEGQQEPTVGRQHCRNSGRACNVQLVQEADVEQGSDDETYGGAPVMPCVRRGGASNRCRGCNHHRRPPRLDIRAAGGAIGRGRYFRAPVQPAAGNRRPQQRPNFTLLSPTRQETSQQPVLECGPGASGDQQVNSGGEDGGSVNFTGRIRFIASDSSDDDLTDAILFNTFLPSGNNGSNGDQQENNDGNGGDS